MLASTCAGLGALEPGAQTGPCQGFFDSLDAVPHVELTLREGSFESLWDGERHAGCEVIFRTTDSLSASVPVPSFDAVPGSPPHERGWREVKEIRADGAGSGIYGLEKAGTLCVVRWEQPAYLDDEGEVVQSETLTIRVQCRAEDPAEGGGVG